MEAIQAKDSKIDNRKPRNSRSPLPRQRRGGRERSRSPLSYGDSRISSDTQRNETHLKRGRLFVGNIAPKSVSKKDLSDVFGRYGEVVAVSIHSGYAFVQMDSEKSANAAVNLENGRSINGIKINVEFSSAAIKAGARMKRLSFRSSRSPPAAPVPPPSHPVPESHYERERRMARILALESELEQEFGYLHRERDPIDYDYGYRSSNRRAHSDYAPVPSSSYPPRELDRDYRPPKPRPDLYTDRLPLSSGSAAYSHRDISPVGIYRGSSTSSAGYGGGSREWSDTRVHYQPYPPANTGGRQNWS